jgi:hypothetical protein
MVTEAAIITRSLIDLEMRLAAIVKTPEFAAQLIVNDEFDLKTRLEAVLRTKHQLTPAQVKQYETKIKLITDSLVGKSKKSHQLEQLAAKAGQSDLYNIFFRYYSGFVHSTPTDLKSHAKRSKDQSQIIFTCGPSFSLVPFYLSMAIFIFAEFIAQTARFAGMPKQHELDIFNVRLKSLKSLVVVPPFS